MQQTTTWSLGVAAALALASLAGAEEAGKGMHGALPMVEQLLAAREAGAGGRRDPSRRRGSTRSSGRRSCPTDNAMTPERVALGRKLYFDTRLSRDGTVACATCHDVTRGFTDQRPVSEGIGDKLGRRNAPTTLNALFFQTLVPRRPRADASRSRRSCRSSTRSRWACRTARPR